jgi:hypothetical protein
MWLGIQHYWSYPWDYIDLGVFTLFAFFIFTRKPTIFFIALFLLEIINRESALFIPLFLVIDAFHIELSSKNIRLSVCHKSKLLIGMLLITLGILYTKFIRHFLFIESSIKAIADDSSHQLLGNHFLLKDNVRAFFHNFLTKDFVVSVFIVLMVLFLLGNVKKFSEVQLKALVLFMSLLISIFLFGLINETRMLTVLLPFLLFFHISFKRENQSNGRLKSGSVLF